MADDVKARKLAAARRKLKEYQAKEKAVGGSKSDQEQQVDVQDVRQVESTEPVAAVNIKTSAPPSSDISVASLSKSNASSFDSETASINGAHTQHPQPIEHFLPASSELAHSNTIELLINEKASLCSELAHYRADSKEKSLALEEASVRLQDALKRIEKLEKDLLSAQSNNAQSQANIERLTATVVQSQNEADKLRQENVDLRDHVEELKQTLQKNSEQVKALEDRLKEKECELELNQIRINQISDVASVENDSKVEALTQTKFMHEQQIRDLQAMVQQLETEREQSNQQYQNYVQHLNKEITSFSERNSKLTEENTRLAERERGLVEHVGELEKQLQQIIANQSKQSAVVEQHDSDRKTISEEEVERRTKELLNEKNVLSEKVQLQDAQIADMQRLMDGKLELIQQLEERIENFTSMQSDSTKLLAKVESNSVAASRAVAQNEELKKQLDEVQTKLIQVTNDKVELTNLLDAERYGNREIKGNYEKMETQLTTLTEKLHFKDEEMIRLTKENTELNEKIEKLKGVSRPHVDRDHFISHNGKHEHGNDCDHSHDHSEEAHEGHEHSDSHEHDHCHDHNHDHDHGADHHHDHDHSHIHGAEDDHHHNHDHHNHDSCQATKFERTADESSTAIPQSEAMQKLEARFKSLMNDVANLTDEKQRLEHLVLQLQGETDTIGEYIALYQAQRRVLKQREIEKNTQLHKLKSEREELHNKVTLLNQLVNNLSQQVGAQMMNNNINVPDQQQPNEREQLQSSVQDRENARSIIPNSTSEESQTLLPNTKQLNSNEIIHAIKNIVADIKNSETNDFDLSIVPTLDHCSCCSGKFETI